MLRSDSRFGIAGAAITFGLVGALASFLGVLIYTLWVAQLVEDAFE